jgi:hypothetical protein
MIVIFHVTLLVLSLCLCWEQTVVAWPLSKLTDSAESYLSLTHSPRKQVKLFTSTVEQMNDEDPGDDFNPRRRSLLSMPVILLATPSLVLIPTQNDQAMAVQQAVGSGEVNCRTNNNCWEVGEWDGAIGWGWGGKDRCDPNDPRCGTDGKLRETAILGQPIPTVPTTMDRETGQESKIRFTHVAAIEVEVGRNEVGVLKIGFYGNESPGAVQQLVDFLSESGFVSTVTSSSFIGMSQPAVSLRQGGIVTNIAPNKAIEFGVPLQSVAYAKSLGRSKVADTFVPQPRPKNVSYQELFVKNVRPHDCAGLISIPEKGLGYGGTGFESDDECFESAFLITASSIPTLDQQGRIIVGQILDAESMAFLERLANIPTKRGIRGVIPGQTSGPPLPKVVVRRIEVSKVSGV